MLSHLAAMIRRVGSYDKRLLELAGHQHYVVGRSQLLELGHPKKIEYRLKNGSLERIHRSAYRVAGSPRTWRQSLTAACFAGGKFSVASFRAAAKLWDLPGGEEVCEITSLRHRRSRHDGVIPHESRFHSERDVTYVDGVPVTRPARTINDLGLLVEEGTFTAAELDEVMHEAVRRDLVDVASVWREWERLHGRIRPGGDAVAEMLERFVPPVGKRPTRPELKLLQLVRRAGLPEPVLQFRVWLSETRWVDLDVAWPEWKVFAEFDPYKWHGSRHTYMQTIARRLAIENLGWRGVPVTDDELDAGAPLALGLLASLLPRRR